MKNPKYITITKVTYLQYLLHLSQVLFIEWNMQHNMDAVKLLFESVHSGEPDPTKMDEHYEKNHEDRKSVV